MEGYVKLYRKLLFNPVFQNANLLKVFIWCLLRASYKPREVLVGLKTIQLQPGQLIYGRKTAAEELDMPESTVRNYVQILKHAKILDIKSDSKYSIVTIQNWALYQSDDDKLDSYKDTCRTGQGQVKDRSRTQTRKVKKSKESKEGKENKIQYADFVSLTNAEYNALVEKLGEDGAKRCIEILDNYKGSTGKKYKSDYRTILNWVVQRYEEEQQKNKSKAGNKVEFKPKEIYV